MLNWLGMLTVHTFDVIDPSKEIDADEESDEIPSQWKRNRSLQKNVVVQFFSFLSLLFVYS